MSIDDLGAAADGDATSEATFPHSSERARVVRVGLTGGIGSGKSAVSTLLRQHGAIVVDADELSREVVEPGTDGLEAVVARFGPDVVDHEGRLNRAALGMIVFADSEARRDLEAIIHPRVRARAAALEASAKPGSVVVHDVPLLVETGQASSYPIVVVVDVPQEVQVERLMTNRGMSREEALSRISAQATRDERQTVADVVLDNTGTLDDLAVQVDRLWATLTARDPSITQP